MKRLIYFVVAATFAASIVTSCGKTTKGKMDGEWTIASSTETETDLSSSPNNSSTTSINGSSYTSVNVYNGSTTTDVGVVNTATWTIKKDGTWERTIVITETSGSTTYKTTRIESGKWDFLKSVSKDYKNNERVIFHVLEDKFTRVTTTGSTSSTYTDNDSYLDGQVSFIYIVTESKKNTLSFNLDGAHTNSYTNGSGITTDKETSKSTYSLTK